MIISDYKMPGMNGGDFLAAAGVQLPTAHLILLSGYAALFGQTAATVLTKPWDDEALLSECRRRSQP